MNSWEDSAMRWSPEPDEDSASAAARAPLPGGHTRIVRKDGTVLYEGPTHQWGDE